MQITETKQLSNTEKNQSSAFGTANILQTWALLGWLI
jgi:hypothetical protein